MSDELTRWEAALETIPERAREGKTASRLIAAAEVEIADRDKQLETVKEMTESERESVKKICAHKDQQIIDVMSKWDEAESKLKEALNPRPRQSATNEDVEYDMKAPYPFSTWRMDQIESVLMWLKLQGADDSTRIKLQDGLNIHVPFASFDNTIAPPSESNDAEDDDPKEKPRWYDRWWVPMFLGLILTGTSVVGTIRLLEMAVGS